MYQLIMIIHMFAAVSLILLVLVQQGKGATTGAAFGSGASSTVFGSRGSGSFLMKVTIGFVVIFFSTSISLNYLASRMVKQPSQAILPIPMPSQNKTVAPSVTPSNIPTSTSLPVPSTKPTAVNATQVEHKTKTK